jgi:hypothetical protein
VVSGSRALTLVIGSSPAAPFANWHEATQVTPSSSVHRPLFPSGASSKRHCKAIHFEASAPIRLQRLQPHCRMERQL